MVKTRSQEDDPVPQWFSRWEEAYEQRFSRWEKAYDQWISRLEDMAADLLCRSRKKENPEDQICNDEELTEIEAETKSSGIEDRAVENEANSDVISASVKKEQIPQIQVPTSKLERGLQIHYVSPTVCEDSQYVVGCDELFGHQEAMLHVSHVEVGDELLTKSTDVTNNQAAHYLFDKMPLRMQSKRRQIKCHKSWRFKFKERRQRRDKLRSAHQLIHRGNVMYKYLCSSAKVALMKKNKLSITWPMLKDDCFIEDDQVSHETILLWLLVRFKNWKFKYKHKHPLRIVPCNAQHGFRGRKKSMCKLRPQQRLCVLEILERSMVPSLLSSVSVSRGILHPNESDFIEWNEYGTVNSSSVWHRWRYKRSLVMRAQKLLLGDESFQIKHKWRFKLLPRILECELYSDRLVPVTNYAQQFDISGPMILKTVGTLSTNLRSQLLFKALKWSIH